MANDTQQVVRKAVREFGSKQFDVYHEYPTDEGKVWHMDGRLSDGRRFWVSFNTVTEQGVFDIESGAVQENKRITWKKQYNTVVKTT